MSWMRYLRTQTDHYFKPYVQSAISALTPIAAAVKNLYYSDPIQHIGQGIGQFVRARRFIGQAKETQNVLIDSIVVNGLFYLISAVLYRRFINTLYLKLPNILHSLLGLSNGVFMLTYISRLYVRGLTDNVFISLNLTSAITHDIEQMLPVLLAETFAKELSILFAKIFLNTTNAEKIFYPDLVVELQIIFNSFFIKFAIPTPDQYKMLLNNFTDAFVGCLHKQDLSNITNENEIRCIAAYAATKIIEVFIDGKNINAETDKAITKILRANFSIIRTEELIREFNNRLSKALFELKAYLPKEYIESCQCYQFSKLIKEPARLIKASLASMVYYTVFSDLMPLIPEGLNFIFVVRENALWMMRNAFWLMKLLILGHNLNELKVAGCTRHRYQVFSRNKILALTLAVICSLSIEISSTLLKAIFDYDKMYQPGAIDNLLRDIAVRNVVLQIAVISILATRESLPGTKKNTWDFFYLPRKWTRETIQNIQWLFANEDKNPSESLYNQIKYFLGSPYFHAAGEWLLQGYAPYPKKLVNLIKNRQLTNPPKIKCDILSVLIQRKMVKLYFQSHMDMVAEYSAKLKIGRRISKWVPAPVLHLPMPAVIFSILSMLLLCLQDDALKKILKQVDKEVKKIKKSIEITVIDEKDSKLIPTKKSPYNYSKIVLALSESKEIKPHLTLTKVDDDFELVDDQSPKATMIVANSSKKEEGDEEEDEEDGFCIVPYAKNKSLLLWKRRPEFRKNQVEPHEIQLKAI